AYFFYNARLGLAGGGPAVWDPSGEEMYDCLFCDWDWFQPVSDGLRFEKLSLPNSLAHEVLSPLQRYHLTYARPRCERDLEWQAVMPAQPASMAELEAGGIRHFDQPGRITGTVRLDGEQLDIDCFSLRDRTWGPQRFDKLPPGDYLWSIASPADNWHAIT